MSVAVDARPVAGGTSGREMAGSGAETAAQSGNTGDSRSLLRVPPDFSRRVGRGQPDARLASLRLGLPWRRFSRHDPIETVVAVIAGHLVTFPGCTGLLEPRRARSPAEAVRLMSGTVRRLAEKVGELFPAAPTFQAALAGLSSRSVILIDRFGALGDLIQLRAVLGPVVSRLGDECPAIWLKTRKQYVPFFRRDTLFGRVVSRYPPVSEVDRIVPIHGLVEVDHDDREETNVHRVELFWRYFAGAAQTAPADGVTTGEAQPRRDA